MKIQELNDKLKSVGYISNKRINYAILSAIDHKKPLILEGAPGAGKTSLAKAISEAFDLPLKRVQFYEGLTVDKLIYDY
ncbi:AAA family ATPase, partial [Streptococcus danieliae]|nr:AAA family ATPase [Streptococcus danieliae]